MVILIGAESSTGKTLMAQKLLEKYKMPYLSADHLKMGLYRADKNCGFTPKDSNEAIEKYLWPILKEIIKTNIENNQNIIIEGCYIFPNRLKEFEQEYIAEIIPIFMGFSQNYINNNFISSILKYNSVIESREAEDRTANWFIQANHKMKIRCAESAINYFEIDDDYNNDVSKIYQWIALEIEKRKSNLLML